jgi:hypothetical protein
MQRIRSHCLECSVELSGRPDKVFCCKHCRIAYHNKKNKLLPGSYQQINKYLLKNRRILKKIYKNGIKQVSHKDLAEVEYRFEYFTGTLVLNNSRDAVCCFEFILIKMTDTMYSIQNTESPNKNDVC